MGKVLLWALLIIGGLLIARIIARQGEKHRVAGKAPKQAPRRGPAAAIPQPESMVQCAHCGVHMPRSEALLTNGQTWCCPEHARLGPRR